MGAVKKIFILHGWAYSTNKWQQFITILEKGGFSPVILNVPGLTEKTDKTWTLNDYVTWLNEKLGKEKAILIGHSNGGRIALALAAKYPERLKHLILIDSAGIYHNELPIRFKRFVFKAVAKLGKKITSSGKLKGLLYKAARESDYRNATPQMRQTMVNLISADLTPQLGKITTPTLIIWGRLDRDTPLSDAELIQRVIKGSKLHIVDNARHSPQFTDTKKVCGEILKEIR